MLQPEDKISDRQISSIDASRSNIFTMTDEEWKTYNGLL